MKLSGINQLWVADITYIRLKAEFVYLAVILDGFSRKVVGWALRSDTSGTPYHRALEQAIERRQPEPGLVHHSDSGFQYAHAEYISCHWKNLSQASAQESRDSRSKVRKVRKDASKSVFATPNQVASVAAY